MSNIDAHVTDGLSRRSVVKGAAWAMPAVVVAAPAPLVAASTGALTFTTSACKLPGNSSDSYKGYVFELNASSTGSPTNTVTVVTGVTVNGVSQQKYAVAVRSGACTCSSCGNAPANQQFCTPGGSDTQRVLLYTDGGTNSNGTVEMCLTYSRYTCDCTALPGSQNVTLCSGTLSTPPTNGGSCKIADVFPLPS